MSLRLMKERVKHSGFTVREEMIIDGQNLLKEELEHDSSYSPTMFFWNPVLGCDDRPAKVRIYNRKYSSLNGNYQNFLTTYDNPIKIGEYLHDTKDDTYWLIYNSFNVNDVHYEGKMIQCNYLLRWQLSSGKIIERYTNIVSASKYDVGESGNSTLQLSSNNYTILFGYCEEGFELEGKRVFIDMRHINPIKVFKITRSDDVLYNSGNMGALLSFIADKDEFNPEFDNQELRICNYIKPELSPSPVPQPPDEVKDLRCEISGSKNLKNGYTRTYTASLFNKEGNAVNWDDTLYNWNIQSDFDIEKIIAKNKIKIKVNDETLIGLSFSLQVISKTDNSIIAEDTISIIELIAKGG